MFDLPDTTPGPPHPGDATAGALAVSCVDAALDAVAVAAAMPADMFDGAQLRGLTLQLEQLRRTIDAAECHALAELDRRRHTDLRLGAATSKWLAHGAHLPGGVARSRLALAKRLADDAALAPVAEALDAGAVGVDHAKVLAGAVNERNAAALAPVLDELIQASQAMVFAVWKRHVEHLAAMADPDGTHDPERDLLGNRLTLSPSTEFMLVRGELVGEHALTVADVLNAVADELYLQFHRDAEASDGAITVPPRSTLLALALEQVCHRAMGTDPSRTAKPKVEVTLTLHAGPGASPGDEGDEPAHPDHLDIWALHHRLLGPLPVDRLPSILCDASFHAVVVDSLGVPADLGREHRHPTPAQRRALLARDGCCTFPGCDAHLGWLDAHHVRHWRHDGLTDLCNLVLLCRRHHRVAHRRGWSLTLDDDGWTRWTTPGGHSFWGQRHHRQRAGPHPQ